MKTNKAILIASLIAVCAFLNTGKAAASTETEELTKRVADLEAKSSQFESRIEELERQPRNMWSCTAMCGRTNQNFKYVYGNSRIPANAFQQMEASCSPPNGIFVGYRTVGNQIEYIPANLNNACVKADSVKHQ